MGNILSGEKTQRAYYEAEAERKKIDARHLEIMETLKRMHAERKSSIERANNEISIVDDSLDMPE